MSGMVTFTTKGDINNAKKVLESMKCFTLAESLGKFFVIEFLYFYIINLSIFVFINFKF